VLTRSRAQRHEISSKPFVESPFDFSTFATYLYLKAAVNTSVQIPVIAVETCLKTHLRFIAIWRVAETRGASARRACAGQAARRMTRRAMDIR
jgi:hypothetical protein